MLPIHHPLKNGGLQNGRQLRISNAVDNRKYFIHLSSTGLRKLNAETLISSLDARQQLISELGFTSLETVGVIHRGPCYGIVLRHKDGWSLA